MLLLIDIGNTNIKIGCYEKGAMRDILRLVTVIDGRKTIEYSYILESFIKHHHIKKLRGSVLCSVVHEVSPVIMKAINKSFGIEPLIITDKTRTGIKFPDGIGADRVAQVVAAQNLYKGDLIIISFGTATVFDVITQDGSYRGGAIIPGIDLSLDALAGGTSRLPKVELRPLTKLLSKGTEDNILTGVILGHAGAVERIISEIQKDIGRKLKIITTGGLAGFIKPFLNINILENQNLTFEGLRLIYEMNESS